MFERPLRTEIDIAAPPTQVWGVLTDFDRWSEWNATLLAMRVDGGLHEGNSARLTIQVGPPVGPRTITVHLVTVRENRALAWRGGLTKVLAGCHAFELEPTDAGTRLLNFETFAGVLVPPLMPLLAPRLHPAYRRLNEALRQRCEHADSHEP